MGLLWDLSQEPEEEEGEAAGDESCAAAEEGGGALAADEGEDAADVDADADVNAGAMPSLAHFGYFAAAAAVAAAGAGAAAAEFESMRTTPGLPSPSAGRTCRGPGIPCTPSSFTEIQHTAGKGTLPGTPLNRATAPCSIKNFSTAESISPVVTPGLTIELAT